MNIAYELGEPYKFRISISLAGKQRYDMDNI